MKCWLKKHVTCKQPGDMAALLFPKRVGASQVQGKWYTPVQFPGCIVHLTNAGGQLEYFVAQRWIYLGHYVADRPVTRADAMAYERTGKLPDFQVYQCLEQVVGDYVNGFELGQSFIDLEENQKHSYCPSGYNMGFLTILRQPKRFHLGATTENAGMLSEITSSKYDIIQIGSKKLKRL